MAPPSAQTVLGGFDGAEFKHQGVTLGFCQRDGKFMVCTDGADGKLADFEVVYTFGVAPQQQHLISSAACMACPPRSAMRVLPT
jgi:hypothetical protein